jgi:hypothetical protein
MASDPTASMMGWEYTPNFRGTMDFGIIPSHRIWILEGNGYGMHGEKTARRPADDTALIRPASAIHGRRCHSSQSRSRLWGNWGALAWGGVVFLYDISNQVTIPRQSRGLSGLRPLKGGFSQSKVKTPLKYPL